VKRNASHFKEYYDNASLGQNYKRATLVSPHVSPDAFVFSLHLHPAAVVHAGQRVPGAGGRVSKLRVCRGRRLHQRSERKGHAHGRGLRDHESCIGDGGVHRRLLLPG